MSSRWISAFSGLFFVVFCVITNPVFSQQGRASDSLLAVTKSTVNDTVKVDAFNRLMRMNLYKDPGKSLEYAHKALDLSQKINFTHGICFSNLLLGIYYKNSTDFLKATDYTLKAIRIAEKNNFLQELVIGYGNLGNINYIQVNLNDALKYFEKSLSYAKITGDPQGIARALNNVAIVFYDQKQYPKALDYFNQALSYATKIGDKEVMANFKASIANVYNKQNRKEEALALYLEAEKETKSIGNKKLICESLNNLGNFYAEQNEWKKSIEKYNEGLPIAKEIENTDLLKIAYEGLAKGYAQIGDYRQAFNFHTLFKDASDSLNQAEVTRKQTQMEMGYEFEKKETSFQNTIERQKFTRNITLAILAMALLFLVMLVNRYRLKKRVNKELEIKNRIITDEKERSEELLLNILPAATAVELKEKGHADAKRLELVTVMFTDFKGFTNIAEKLSPEALVNELDFCFRGFDEIISKHRLEKIKTIGDSYMAAGGLPVVNDTHADDVVEAALEIIDFLNEYKSSRLAAGLPFFEVRIGVHSGPVVAGIVGSRKFAYDIWGDTVNIASRMESSGEPGKVNISSSTRSLLKGNYRFTERGKVEAKNKGLIEMFFIEKSVSVPVN